MSAGKATDRTGKVWEIPAARRRGEVRRVCDILEKSYGPPRTRPPEDPLDTLIRLVISTRTRGETTRAVFDALKTKYPDFESLKRARTDSIRKILKPAGLSATKAGFVELILHKVEQDFGSISLKPLRGRPRDEVYDYLVSLPGVSDKVAACTMLFALDHDVLPVDTHVLRIANRLGWSAAKAPKKCRLELEALVPPARRHAFHINCIAHGRAHCRNSSPRCADCPLLSYCVFGEDSRLLV